MKIFTSKFIAVIAGALLFGAAHQAAVASSATWSATATSGDWNTANNWTPSTIPNSTTDVATFGQSAVTNLSINTTSVSVDSIVYLVGASPYTITTDHENLSLYGNGIANDSGVVQSLNLGEDDGLFFFDFATAGEMTSFGGSGGQFYFNDYSSAGAASFDVATGDGIEATLAFFDSTTAADATITIGNYAPVDFFDYSTAANAVIQANAGGFLIIAGNATADHMVVTLDSDGALYIGSSIYFQEAATAANGNFTAKGAASRTGFGSNFSFIGTSTAGDATFVLNGGTAQGAPGATMTFSDTSTAENALVTINGGTNKGKGASVYLTGSSIGGTAQFAVYGNGSLDVRQHDLGGVTIGSLEGDGTVLLAPRQLSVGSANSSTTFSGSIQDGSKGTGGSLSKVGTGTLTLTGASIYTGATYVNAGALIAGNTKGSATGTGNVAVSGGTLGGGGTISGAVTVGTGSNSGATLQPSFGTNKKIALTIQGLLTLMSDSTYSFSLKSKKAELVANGVTIMSGAQFTLTAPKGKLRAGIRAPVISNTSSMPISGTFANLPDGATITSGGNTYQANYKGGDGNDLTLTVQP